MILWSFWMNILLFFVAYQVHQCFVEKFYPLFSNLPLLSSLGETFQLTFLLSMKDCTFAWIVEFFITFIYVTLISIILFWFAVEHMWLFQKCYKSFYDLIISVALTKLSEILFLAYSNALQVFLSDWWKIST